MSNTENRLTAKDICSIIRSCKDSGVSEIKLGDTVIKFGVSDFPQAAPISAYTPQPGSDVAQEIPQSNSQELQDALLAVEDPVAWEARQLMGDQDE